MFESLSHTQLKNRLLGAAILAIILAVVVPFILSEPTQIRESTDALQSDGFTSKIQPIFEQQEQVEQSQNETLALNSEVVSQAALNATSGLEPSNQDAHAISQMESLGKIVDLLSDSKKVKLPIKSGSTSTVVAKTIKVKSKSKPIIKNGWVVQAGVFSDPKNAQSIAQILRSNGFQPSLTKTKTDAGLGTRVWMGPFATKESAEMFASKVKQKTGNSGYVAPFPFNS